MWQLFKRLVNTALYPLGYQINKTYHGSIYQDEAARRVIDLVHPTYTCTGVDRIYALIEAVGYVATNKLDGDFVECGVWRGGSTMAMAEAALETGILPKIWLFDTFEGMTAPTEEDRDVYGTAMMGLQNILRQGWMKVTESEVEQNLCLTSYPHEKFRLVRGPVEETIPDQAPEKIALLRLDTDWYQSTKHELEHLYPRVVEGGVVIIDDYGDFEGAKRATDEFFEALGTRPYLVPVAGHRVFIKHELK
ncbi:MAG: macrocin O-methyltransferase [Rhodospirillaceae bacterium]|nr:macrocin O-methyltransferase [Rhodospirillaceae bacterium]|tara:strand:+ start:301 stop:1047 length:747 start_codon:yes stop_codon:yes gene_type:complete